MPDSLERILDELRRPARAADMPRRIELCQQALEMISKRTHPELWGALQNVLAISLVQNPLGDRAENLERSIFHFQQALEVRTRQAFPQDWAQTMNNLGNAYKDRIRGDRAENLEQAIYHYQQALGIYTQQAFPEQWAMTQNNLAAAYRERIRGDRAENLEQAIFHYQQALKVRTYQTFPQDWAKTMNNLGNAYRDRIRGERAENLEQAIFHYQQALEVRTHQAFPEQWANTQNSLGSAYGERIRGERAENLEQAIFHHQQALEVRTHQAFPQDWAQTMNNLGNAYLDRIRGDRAENLEQAIFHYQQALKVRTRQAFPQDWAQTMNNLGSAYRDRIRGERAENLEQAIFHYQQALEVYALQAFPEQWAMTQNSLGSAYRDRIRGERAENLEQAIFHYQQALEVYARQAFPEDWAMAQNNLGNAYRERIRGERAENLEQAIVHYQQALEILTSQAFPQHWAITQHNLAHIYSDRIRGERAENLEQAIFHYQQALEILTHQAFPKECRLAARALGYLAFREQRWTLAVNAYSAALTAQGVLMQTSFTRSGKHAELKEIEKLPPHAAYSLVQLGEIEQAVEVLEQSRAHLLREALERQRRDLEQLPDLGFEDLYEEYIGATKEYDILHDLVTENTSRENWISQVESAWKRMQEVAAVIRDEAGQVHPQYRYFLQALPFAEIQKQTADKPLVYLMATSAGGLGLVVSQQGVRGLLLPALTEGALRDQLSGLANDTMLSGYLGAYIDWRNDPSKEDTRVAWLKALDETTRWLWDVVMRELITALHGESESVTLIPIGLLALLPFHAAWTADTTQPTGRRYAIDELSITYVPSAHALWQASLASGRPTDVLMAVDNPDGTLIFSESEVKAALDVFEQAAHLPREKANLSNVKSELQKAQVLHFSTHGIAGWLEAEQARLKLADGDLTLPDIFRLHLSQSRLAVLSACETGVPTLELIDEMIGLPASMMQAGVPGVIGSLWSVNDMSTAMLMARFYSLWREEGLNPQEALRQAQIWLRDSTTIDKKRLFKHFVEKQTIRMSSEAAQAFYQHIGWDDPDACVFASPYYWAAFTYTGV